MDGSVKDRERDALPAPVGGVPLTQSPVLVHVGLARTGTTWLQKHVFANSPHIFTPADPSLEPMERAKQLARRLCKDERERVVNELDFDIDGFRRECDLIAVPAGKSAVISSERLSGSVLSGGFDRATSNISNMAAGTRSAASSIRPAMAGCHASRPAT